MKSWLEPFGEQMPAPEDSMTEPFPGESLDEQWISRQPSEERLPRSRGPRRRSRRQPEEAAPYLERLEELSRRRESNPIQATRASWKIVMASAEMGRIAARADLLDVVESHVERHVGGGPR